MYQNAYFLFLKKDKKQPLPIDPTPAKTIDITIQIIEAFQNPYPACHSSWILAWLIVMITPTTNKVMLHNKVQIFTNINKILALFLLLSTISCGESVVFGASFGGCSSFMLLFCTFSAFCAFLKHENAIFNEASCLNWCDFLHFLG